MRLNRRDDRTRDVFVKIGTTDAAARGPNHDLARAGFPGRADIFYPEVTSIVKPKCAHYAPRSRRYLVLHSHGTIRSARRRSKSSRNDDWESRMPSKPRRRLRPMSVNVSIVLPRSASVCHQEAIFSTAVLRNPWRRTLSWVRPRSRRPSDAAAESLHRRTEWLRPRSASASRGQRRRQRNTSPLTMLSASIGSTASSLPRQDGQPASRRP